MSVSLLVSMTSSCSSWLIRLCRELPPRYRCWCGIPLRIRRRLGAVRGRRNREERAASLVCPGYEYAKTPLGTAVLTIYLRHFARYDDRLWVRGVVVCAPGSVLDVGLLPISFGGHSFAHLHFSIFTDLAISTCAPFGASPSGWGSFPPWPSSYGG